MLQELLPKLHDPAAYQQHSDDLYNDRVESGVGPVKAYEINLAFNVDTPGMESWTEGTDFFRTRLEDDGWFGRSAGTGWGERDMQFIRVTPLSKEEFDQLVQDALKSKIDLDHLNQYGVNEWGEQVQDDTPHDFFYVKDEEK